MNRSLLWTLVFFLISVNAKCNIVQVKGVEHEFCIKGRICGGLKYGNCPRKDGRFLNHDAICLRANETTFFKCELNQTPFVNTTSNNWHVPTFSFETALPIVVGSVLTVLAILSLVIYRSRRNARRKKTQPVLCYYRQSSPLYVVI